GFGRFVGHGRQDTGAPFRTRPAPASAPASLRPWPWLFVGAASAASSWLPLRRQTGPIREGFLLDQHCPGPPPPSLPLPSQGEGQEQSSRLKPLLRGIERSDRPWPATPALRLPQSPSLIPNP